MRAIYFSSLLLMTGLACASKTKEIDAAVVADSRTADAAANIDATATIDAVPLIDAVIVDAANPPDANFDVDNGCTLGQALDRRNQQNVTITFTNFSYTPPCLRIATNTTVRFEGNFMMHPMRGGKVMGGIGVPDNTSPIPLVNMGESRTFTFTEEGKVLYYCAAHTAMNMAGAIYVEAP